MIAFAETKATETEIGEQRRKVRKIASEIGDGDRVEITKWRDASIQKITVTITKRAKP